MEKLSKLSLFNELFDNYYRQFVRFAIGYLKDSTMAEDYVSEAFIAYWENRNTLTADTNPPAYILAIVKNKCINHLQREQMRQRVEKQLSDHSLWALTTRINTLEACNPEMIFSNEVKEIIDRTLSDLPEKTRQIFLLSRNEDLSHKEIAERITLSTKAIEFHISKALAALRISLKDFMILLPFAFLLFK
ncbi:MAG TPA: RNA polymerase sigma-70 factor [Porphyromonadaceae bacterium]|jgi:RNA polymerase sigma-70 factor (ECF subfamily)|nr:RNA polymerase sigma-70 factor [Porphyromonadaceae bacterium]HBK31254.1 RNA polymerase sigma-70 factor [Porphyromonadaceae bacterium]HBL33963.1 RNA polymerase sigma-70 factor [Porphyromonadaceae bacterium]HBX18882.1 RNA polymerase sigma-70 factor [Porphyromonadaceae bacterium]HCM21164.1 RNA polymerase sigma-70 factor [Porphyromonadaceae bacterium]